jgi:hypothetical protein
MLALDDEMLAQVKAQPVPAKLREQYLQRCWATGSLSTMPR